MAVIRENTPLRDTYLVTEKLARVADVQIDEIERELQISLPGNYREYATTLGIGEYCDILSVYEPARIRSSMTFMQETFGDFCYWDGTDVGISEAEILQCFPFASTSNGDYFVVHRQRPMQVFALPRGDDKVLTINSKKIQIQDIYYDMISDAHRHSFRQFESFVDRQHFEIICREAFTLDELTSWLETSLGEQGHHFEHTVLADSVHSHLFLRSIQGRVYASSDRSRNVGRISVGFDKERAALAETIRRYASSKISAQF